MTKSKKVEALNPNSVIEKAWETLFYLANETVRESSKQIDALIGIVADSVASSTRLARTSNERLAALTTDVLTATESGGRRLVSRTRATALTTAQRASETARALVAPRKAA